MAGVGFKLDAAKALFFDRAAVMSRVNPAVRSALGRCGAMIRRDARSSIKPIGKKKKAALSAARKSRNRKLARQLEREATSKPGQPPRSVIGLLRMIFYSYDPGTKSVVVGPALLNAKSAGQAPRTLEEGGTVKLRSKRGKVRTVHIAPRPFMGPPFSKHYPKLPALLKDSVKP